MMNALKTIFHKIVNSGRGPGCIQEVDGRNFLGKNLCGDITRADINELPFSNFDTDSLIDQSYTDFCVACGLAYGAEATEGVQMSWRGAYAIFCKYIGSVPAYGASVLKMLLSRVKYGIPERRLCEFIPANGRDWNASPANLSYEAFANAGEHRAESVWEANRPDGWDRFDTFRAWLWKFHNKKIVIQTGIDSHNVTLCKQLYHPVSGELCLAGPDSYGKKSINYRVGKSINGWRYWTRAEVNQLPAGNFLFDIPVDLAKLLNKYNEKAIKTKDNPVCYIVRNGQRHSLVNEYVALSNNTLMYEPDNVYEVSAEEMNTIPLGDPVKFKDGKNWQLVQRILEKVGATQAIKNLTTL